MATTEGTRVPEFWPQEHRAKKQAHYPGLALRWLRAMLLMYLPNQTELEQELVFLLY